jgi:HEAT repeat protein
MSEYTVESLITEAEISINAHNWSLAVTLLERISQIISRQSLSTDTEQSLKTVINLAIAVLEKGDFATRWDVAKLFPRWGEAAIAPLLEILENDYLDTEYRWFVARILANFSPATVIPALTKLMQETTDEELQVISSQSLANLGKEAIDTLSDLLTNTETRLFATEALGQIHSPLTIAPLLTVIDDPNPHIRQRAIASLINYPDPRIPPILIKAVEDLSSMVRKEAVIGISLNIQSLSTIVDLPALLKPLLGDINLEVGCQTINCFGKIATTEAIQILYELLPISYVPEQLKLEVIRTLGQIPTTTALQYLEKALYLYQDDHDNLDPNNTTDYLFVKEIIHSFGQVNLPNLQAIATDILLRFVQSDHPALLQPEIRQSLVLTWGYLGDNRTIDYLILFLADENARVKLHCLAALQKLDTDLAYEKLTSLAQESDLMPELQNGIAIALAEWEKSDTQSGL